MLARVFAAARAGRRGDLREEIDPNGAIAATSGTWSRRLGPRGTPRLRPGPPIEALIDVAADVNRAHPARRRSSTADDYGNIANEISEFCLDKASGLEQVYEVVREATLPNGVTDSAHGAELHAVAAAARCSVAY